MNKQRLIALLLDAFAGVPRDDFLTLHEAQIEDQSLGRSISKEELTAARALDTHESWTEVPGHFLDECDAALSHLSPEGWLFYLPAYMRRAIELIDLPLWESALALDVVFHLTLPDLNSGNRELALKRFALLNEVQVTAVAAFLRFLGANAPMTSGLTINSRPAEALESYWALASGSRPTPEPPIRKIDPFRIW